MTGPAASEGRGGKILETAEPAALSCNTAELIAVIAKQVDCPIDLVRQGARLVDDLGADSLSLVQLVLALEATFDFEIPVQDIPTLLTVGDVHR